MATIKDLQECAEEIVEEYCEKYNLKPIKVRVKECRTGMAFESRGYMRLPVWPYREGNWDYFVAYVLHEICHFIMAERHGGRQLHNSKFRTLEREVLSQWGLVPKMYKRAYYKELYDEDGTPLWFWHRRKAESAGIKKQTLD